jgi:ABC-2 type transport system ATP-binding protein
LNDVETLCDHVCILRRGKVVVSGVLGDLLDASARGSEIALSPVTDKLRQALAKLKLTPRVIAGTLVVDVDGDACAREVLKGALELGANVESVTPKRETLESLFVRRAL